MQTLDADALPKKGRNFVVRKGKISGLAEEPTYLERIASSLALFSFAVGDASIPCSLNPREHETMFTKSA